MPLKLLQTAVALALAMPLQTRQAAPPAVETYEAASIDTDGNLRIVTSRHREIVVRVPPKPSSGDEIAPTGFEAPSISNDRRAVGVLADFNGPGLTYAVPLQLVVYVAGKEHRFGGGLVVYEWHFVDGGRRVAFSQGPLHFNCSTHWELRDLRTDRLVAEVDLPEPCGQNPNPAPVPIPKWATGPTSGIK